VNFEELNKKLYGLQWIICDDWESYEWKPVAVEYDEYGNRKGFYTAVKDGKKIIGKCRENDYEGYVIERLINIEGKKYED